MLDFLTVVDTKPPSGKEPIPASPTLPMTKPHCSNELYLQSPALSSFNSLPAGALNVLTVVETMATLSSVYRSSCQHPAMLPTTEPWPRKPCDCKAQPCPSFLASWRARRPNSRRHEGLFFGGLQEAHPQYLQQRPPRASRVAPLCALQQRLQVRPHFCAGFGYGLRSAVRRIPQRGRGKGDDLQSVHQCAPGEPRAVQVSNVFSASVRKL